MSKKTKVQLASIKYQINGKGKKIDFKFKSFTQPALDKAMEYYSNNHTAKASKLHWNGKIKIGEMLNALTVDETDSKIVGHIHNSMVPGLTNIERSNYKKLASLHNGNEMFTPFKESNFPNLNSETHVLARWRDHVDNLLVIDKPEFKEWINSDDKPDENSHDSLNKVDFNEVDQFVKTYQKESNEPESNETATSNNEGSDVQTLPFDGALEGLSKYANMLITLHNKKEMTADQKDKVHEVINNLHKSVIIPAEIKKAA